MMIKLIGPHGSGKTTLVRMITEMMTGKVCDEWQRYETDEIINHKCICKKFIALGKWKAGSKCCGMDSATSKHAEGEKYNFKGRIAQMYPKYQDKVLFDDGMMNQTKGNTINSASLGALIIYLDYPYQTLMDNIIIKRGGKMKPDNLTNKIHSALHSYQAAPDNQKIRLSGTLEENAQAIIARAGLVPCNCYRGDSLNPVKQSVAPSVVGSNPTPSNKEQIGVAASTPAFGAGDTGASPVSAKKDILDLVGE